MPPKRQVKPKKSFKPLLQSVLQAIVDLHNAKGSTEKQIVRQIEAIFIATGKHGTRQLGPKIKHAINFGIDQGVIRKKGGKYLLAAGIRACRPIKRGGRFRKAAPSKPRAKPKRASVTPRRRVVKTAPKKKRVRKAPAKKTPKKTPVKSRRAAKRTSRIAKRNPTPRPAPCSDTDHSDASKSSTNSKSRSTARSAPYKRSKGSKRVTKIKSIRKIKRDPSDIGHIFSGGSAHGVDDYHDDVCCGNPNCICNLAARNSSKKDIARCDEDSQDLNIET